MSADQTMQALQSLASAVWGTHVDIDADLIAIGFDSIAMIELANRVGEQFGVACTIDDVFESPSLRELARLLDQRIGSR